MTDLDWQNPWNMAGTTSTGEYRVLCHTTLGRLGLRILSGEKIRIRVEPRKGQTIELTQKSGWKQPGGNGQNRYSIVRNRHNYMKVLRTALLALGIEKAESKTTWNPEAKLDKVQKKFGATHAC